MTQSGADWVLGAMSGTSLDGVDAALLHTDGVDILGFGDTGYRAYSDAEREVIRTALGQWDGAPVEAAAAVVEQVHIELLSRFSADLIGFHGQTLAHAPRAQGTLQVGDGARLATALKTPCVWDFRTMDVAFGGEGAPLAPFFHHALARYIEAEGPLCFLNLGGVGNVTWIDPSHSEPDTNGALLAFDTGPANAPINDLLTVRQGLDFDENGAIAGRGVVYEQVVEAFLQDPFFVRLPPKSLDRNDFPDIQSGVAHLDDADAAATLTAICAASVATALHHCPKAPERVLVTGGGRLNPVLIGMISRRVNCPVEAVEAVGLNGDMLEAQAFAYLAARVARGLPTSCPTTTGVGAAVSGGVLSAP